MGNQLQLIALKITHYVNEIFIILVHDVTFTVPVDPSGHAAILSNYLCRMTSATKNQN